VEREEVEREAVEREPLARDPVPRDPAERDPVEREAVEREPVEPDAVERAADERVPDGRDPPERLLLRDPVRALPELERELLLRVERELEVPACVSAARSLSKSLRACLLVLAASRRSARSAAVTSL
jgi:hypothetical protein